MSPLNIWLLSGNLVCGLVILGLIQNDSATSSRSDTQTNESSLRASSQIVETNKLFPQDLLQYIESQRAASEAARAALQRESRILVEVQPGDNLSILFARAGFGPQNVADVLNSVSDTGRLARLFPGYQLAFETDQNSTLSSLEVIASPLESFLYKRNQQGDFEYSHLQTSAHIETVFKEAVINDSLFQASQRSGIPAALALKLAGVFGGVVDFMQDIRSGDSFNVLYEHKSLNGKTLGFGNVLAAQFTNQGKTYTALSYTNAQGVTNFYNPDGESMRKAFLLNPVDFTRISSGFNPARRHPILNTIRAHKGTDYAAPKGTPVVATADGRVTFANRKGSYGKLVILDHGKNFETRYAHLDSYASGVSSGAKVVQGQIIGYVGSTGSATGPHLHYEFLMDGEHRDSRTIHQYLPQSEAIPEAEQAVFAQYRHNLLTLLANKGLSPNTLARNTQNPESE